MIRNLYLSIKAFISAIPRFYYTSKTHHSVKSCGVGLRVNHKSDISGNVIIGDYCNFNGLAIRGFFLGGVEIGDYFHSGSGCLIMLGSHDYENGDAIPYGKGMTSKKVKIDDFVWLGKNVTISRNVHIGEGAVVAIGSVVVNDVPPLAVVGGNPAKIIKYRDSDHYYQLKEQKNIIEMIFKVLHVRIISFYIIPHFI